MGTSSLLFALCVSVASILPFQTYAQSTPNDYKRGLIKIKENSTPSDLDYWTRAGSPLSWYYNYDHNPTEAITRAAPNMQFVPMLWGASTANADSDTSFFDGVLTQLSASPKPNLTHVLSFNEPDGPATYGGSSLTPDVAAKAYMKQLAPLREAPHNLKVGLPAITGSDRGIEWLRRFNESCSSLNPESQNSTEGGCAGDFVCIHWYGDFSGLASFMGQVRAAYPTLPLWITEYALPNANLEDTQAFYNISREYFERLDFVERFSYFGAFRSDVSNVGPNVAFLTQKGELTDIGSWYLGGGETGKIPKGDAAGRRGLLGGSLALSMGLLVVLANIFA